MKGRVGFSDWCVFAGAVTIDEAQRLIAEMRFRTLAGLGPRNNALKTALKSL